MREKLIELIGQVQDCGCDVTDVVEMNYVENITLADHLIANGVVISNSETATKWTPVTERLPEDGVNVLWIKRIDGSQMIAKYEKRRNVWTDGHYYGGMNGVTHWMPLPQPPKGE